jgi:N-acetylmuramoyl-L-alanine amidase
MRSCLVATNLMLTCGKHEGIEGKRYAWGWVLTVRRCGLVLALLTLSAAALLCAAATSRAGGAGADTWGADVSKPEPRNKKPRQGKPATPAAEALAASALGVTFTGDNARTFVKVSLSREVPVEVFTLADPFRVIIELSDTSFAASVQPGTKGKGLVESYHNGEFTAGKGRIVLETLGPVKAITFPLSPASGDGKMLEVALTPVPVSEFGAGTGAGRAGDIVAPVDLPPGATRRPGAPPPAKPVIVIDAGHGGIDPGAIGEGTIMEKNIVMEVARKLEQALQAKGRYRVHMTRTSDTFVSLDQRLADSRKNAANLFISLHADSIEQSSMAQSISGATVYTLSERASDEQARKMAEKENASDLLAGLPTATKEGDEVKDILIDLMKRETSSFSAEFSNVLLGKMRNTIQLSRDPARAAAFKVLKQTHAPSVLIELGYMSNAADAKRLNSPAWQSQIAGAIAAAVDAYFASRTATSR